MLNLFSRHDDSEAKQQVRETSEDQGLILAYETIAPESATSHRLGHKLHASRDSSGHVCVTGVLLGHGVAHPGDAFGRNYMALSKVQEEEEEEDEEEQEVACARPLDETWKTRCMEGLPCTLPYPLDVPKGTHEQITTVMTFVSGATTLTGLMDAASPQDDKFASVSLYISRQSIESHFPMVNFATGGHHLVPLQIELSRSDTRGCPIPLSLTVTTKTPGGKPATWGATNLLPTSGRSVGHVLFADHACNERPHFPLYRANPSAIESKQFMQWMAQDMKRTRRYLASKQRGVYYLVPMPSQDSKGFETPLQHLVASEFRKWMTDLTPDEEREHSAFSTDHMFVTPTGAPMCAQVPVSVLDRRLSEIEQLVDADATMMSIDDGITLEIRPASANGWNDAKMFIARRDTYPTTTRDPNMRLIVELEFTFVPVSGLPCDVGHLSRIPVGNVMDPSV